MKAQFIHSDDGDWVGFYVDGQLVAQGHSLRYEDIVNEFVDEVESIEKDYEWFKRHGFVCPEILEEGR